MNNVFCIIRSIGERTTDLATKLYKDNGIPEIDILNNRGRPFVEVLKKSFVTAITKKNRYRWVIIVDADVIPGRNFKMNMEMALDKLNSSPDVFEFVFLTHDKLLHDFLPPVCGGIRVYRTDLLEAFYRRILHDVERPELEIYRLVRAEGYKALVLRNGFYLAGYHCYEQYYGDLYDKTYYRTLKWVEPHLRQTQDAALNMFSKHAKDDNDFYVCKQAILDAKKDSAYEEKRITSESRTYQFFDVMKNYKIEEKNPLDIETFDMDQLPDLGGPITKNMLIFNTEVDLTTPPYCWYRL